MRIQFKDGSKKRRSRESGLFYKPLYFIQHNDTIVPPIGSRTRNFSIATLLNGKMYALSRGLEYKFIPRVTLDLFMRHGSAMQSPARN